MRRIANGRASSSRAQAGLLLKRIFTSRRAARPKQYLPRLFEGHPEAARARLREHCLLGAALCRRGGAGRVLLARERPCARYERALLPFELESRARPHASVAEAVIGALAHGGSASWD